MPYKKFILFYIPHYYPSGGLDDIVDSFATIDEAKRHAEEKYPAGIEYGELFEIVDRDTWKIVWANKTYSDREHLYAQGITRT